MGAGCGVSVKGTVKVRHALRMADPLHLHSGWTDLMDITEAFWKNPPCDSTVGNVRSAIPPDSVTR